MNSFLLIISKGVGAAVQTSARFAITLLYVPPLILNIVGAYTLELPAG